MERRKEIGFTLVELLAVIVILAIILAISIPGISGIVSNTTKAAFESDAKMILKQFEYEKLENDSFDVTTVTANNLNNFNLSNVNYENLTIAIIDDKPYILIVGRNKWIGLKACGTKQNMAIVAISDTETCEDISGPYNATKGVNKPVLATGMTPIKWDGSTWITTTESDADWYNYTTTDKRWANARTVDGSMWVWIPRYVYKISSGWHTNTAGVIDIQFSMNTDDTRGGTVTLNTGTTANASNNNWTSHQAFTFGTTEVYGIWIAKFEASGTSSAIDVKPNVSSLRSITVNDIFTATRAMETNTRYGWGTSGANIDTHMIKNSEWGAVAYLSQSTYGKNVEIWINPSSDFITGCAGSSVSAGSDWGCPYNYATPNGQQTSTTGNIYGIYDMSGGTHEYVAGYINNSYVDDYGLSLYNSDEKYKDIYSVVTDNQTNNYSNTISKKSDAIYETSSTHTGSNSWYGDYSYMPNSSNPWFTRGFYSDGSSISGIFSFSSNNGSAINMIGFRPIILVGTGL